MELLDYGTIIGRAAYVRSKAGYIGRPPPYSTRTVLEKVFPRIAVAGAALPRGVTEMAVSEKGRRALFYGKKTPHTVQRVSLMHGLYHHLSDIKSAVGLRECNLALTHLRRNDPRFADPLELSCDLFAAEVLIPLDVLSALAPDVLESKDMRIQAAIDDEIDHLSSKFNVPRDFMNWRIVDLVAMRSTHYYSSRGV